MNKLFNGYLGHLSLLNVRIVLLFSAWMHLLVTAFVTLNIDTTVDDDPRIKAYYIIRWKLITCWFNLINLVYLPLRLYGDWSVKQGNEHSRYVKFLYHVTDVLMTGILFPVTLYSDVSFWYIYTKDLELLAPKKLFDYLPSWAQHSLHTVSMIVVILDLILTPRRRPVTIKPRLVILAIFSFVYTAVIYTSYLKGEIVYAVFENISDLQFMLLALASFACVLILFAIQWIVIDLIHGSKEKNV